MGVRHLTLLTAASLFAATTATAQTTAPATPASPGASPATQTAPTSPGASPTTQAAPAAQATPAAQGTPTTQAAPAAQAVPAGTPTVGGAPMLPTRNIVENASAASNLTTLVSAVKAADLVDTLSGPGPFTVFAPNNAAFGRLAPGTLDTLLKPENKPTLVKLLQYHVVPGSLDAAALKSQITAGGGSAKLTTVAGDPLTVTLENNALTLTDGAGNKSYVAQPDVKQSNGMVHVVNGVVVPNLGAPAASPPATGATPSATATPAPTATPTP